MINLMDLGSSMQFVLLIESVIVTIHSFISESDHEDPYRKSTQTTHSQTHIEESIHYSKQKKEKWHDEHKVCYKLYC